MSSITTNATDAPHGDDHHGHSPFLAHHFDSPEQQYTSGKLGMWVFLGTELLMFGGLFCAYAVYRHNHPEVFEYAHTYLNKWWGAVNTVVLLVSSFTMAWAVRCAQLGHRRGLIVLLTLTLLGGAGFMVIKGIEYRDKWEHHLFPGYLNQYNKDYTGPVVSHGAHSEAPAGTTATPAPHDAPVAHDAAAAHTAPADAHGEAGKVAAAAPVKNNPVLYFDPNTGGADAAKIVPTSGGPSGLSDAALNGNAHSGHGGHLQFESLASRDKVRVNTFFSIYFMMTGLHGLHVVVGMGLIAWVLVKGSGGLFGPAYYTPVDLVGLYWHLVDLIWIFLFPLLYLIH